MALETPVAEKLKREYLKPFVEGTIVTLHTMAAITPVIKGIRVVQADKFTGDVSAVMGVTAEQGEGFVGISFVMPLATTVVARILGLEASQLEASDIHDGVGELINMIAGTAKNALLGTPYKFKAALPNVITGKGHEVGFPRNAECWTATFEAEGQDFDLHVAYAPHR